MRTAGAFFILMQERTVIAAALTAEASTPAIIRVLAAIISD